LQIIGDKIIRTNNTLGKIKKICAEFLSGRAEGERPVERTKLRRNDNNKMALN
jgi:hypothetical protein